MTPLFPSSVEPLDICVPYWGDPDVFRLTIDSVRDQTDPAWRLTIIDDGYPGTAIEDYVASLADDRIRYRRNPTNVGITENFRRAIAAGDGTHVVVLGADDLLLPGYVAHVREMIAQHQDVDVIQPGVRVIDAAGHESSSLVDGVKQRLLTPHGGTLLQGEEFARSILVGNWLYWPSLVFRRAGLAGVDFRDGLPIILDLAFLVDIAMKDGILLYTGVECFAYRRHGESLSQTTLQDGSRFADERRFYREVAGRSAARGWRRAARAAHLRVMSRLHALTYLPRVLFTGSSAARASTLKLAFGS